ncbi:serine/threonine protein kinase [Candidatus Venteria ishoeyi]|nr:serine/threonine protein kinase [Candidatus Venteria ishoeyi]
MNTSQHNALPKGYQLEDYRIIKVLGSGGFGITYLAEDMTLKVEIALKEYFPREFAMRESSYSLQPHSEQEAKIFHWGLERFLNEAQMLAKFKHPNIVRVLRFFKANNTAYIVMEYQPGQTLHELLRDGETATTDELFKIFLPLLDGLEAIHREKVYHRDIKPGNIYLHDETYIPILIDFGTARHALGNQSHTITSIVSEGYSPFEQYHNDGTQGAYTDIYALGAVMYRLITGKLPPPAPKRAEALLEGKPDPMPSAQQSCADAYPPNILAAIDWALESKRDQRPQSIDQWRQALQRDVPKEVIPEPQSTPNPLPVKKTHIGTWLLGMLLLIVMLFGGWQWWQLEQKGQVQAQQRELDHLLQEAEAHKRALAAQKQQQEREAQQVKDKAERDAQERARLAANAKRLQQLKEKEEAKQRELDRLLQEAEAHKRALAVQKRQQEREAQQAADRAARAERRRQSQLAEARQREELSRCADGRLNSAQIKKLVTNKVAVGAKLLQSGSEAHSWRETQKGNGRAIFRKRGGNSITGKWNIAYNKLCWCYGDCEEFKCKYVQAENNCSIWYYIDPETGYRTGKVYNWIDLH